MEIHVSEMHVKYYGWSKFGWMIFKLEEIKATYETGIYIKSINVAFNHVRCRSANFLLPNKNIEYDTRVSCLQSIAELDHD